MSAPQRNLRLLGRSGSSLETSGVRGEIYWDNSLNCLRLYDGSKRGGNLIADRSWVQDQIDNIDLFSGNYNDLTNTPTIPSIAGLATEDYVDTAVSNIDIPEVDLTGLATEDYVDTAISNIDIPEVDLTGLATEDYVDTAISNLVDTAPTTLNTLNELAAALGDDANFATTVTTALGTKAPINNPAFTGTVSGITAAMVGLGNVTNESKATMFNNPTFTGTVTGVTAVPQVKIFTPSMLQNISKSIIFNEGDTGDWVNYNSPTTGWVAPATGTILATYYPDDVYYFDGAGNLGIGIAIINSADAVVGNLRNLFSTIGGARTGPVPGSIVAPVMSTTFPVIANETYRLQPEYFLSSWTATANITGNNFNRMVLFQYIDPI
jgi:hypothetical protein